MQRSLPHLLLLCTLLSPAAWGADCSRTTTGFMPLNGPFFRTYQGMPGGLYPNGSNNRPAAHQMAGIALTAQVRPRDAAGAVDQVNGKIVLISVGMSNTTQEFSAFKSITDPDPEKNAKVLIVDGAQGGWSADRIFADGTVYWNTLEQRLRMAGVSDAQVQVGWMKLADARPSLAFPADAQKLQSEMKAISQAMRSRYPNLRLLYLSSRIYAGYASTNLNPEPFAYQGGFAVKWLIEQQIQGDPELSYQTAKAPWMAWGPYLWADGTTANANGLTWNCSDLMDDGTHPSNTGRQKVAAMLLDFFKSDTTARPWFVRTAAQPPPTPVASAIFNSASFLPTVATGAIATISGTDLASTTASAPTVPLPYGLAGTSVDIGGEPAPLYYVSPTQINLVVPQSVMSAAVVVKREGIESGALAAQLGLNTEGLFALDGRGKGPVAAIHIDGRVITEQAPAKLGETIALYGTGMGVRNPLILAPIFLPVVHIGGVMAEVKYYGVAPGFPGLDQINVLVPTDAPTGTVTLDMQLGSFVSNVVSLAVAQK